MTGDVLTTSLTVSLSACAGLLLVRAQIDPAAGGTARQFRFALLVAALFYLVRAADWMTGLALFRALTVVAAAAIPFSALLLAEGLLRRHAPHLVKVAVAGGMAALACLAPFISLTGTPVFIAILLAYQLAAFGVVFCLLMFRERASLSPTENLTADRAVMTLPIIVLLLLPDYDFVPPRDVSYLSGLGALMAAWLTVTFEARLAGNGRVAMALLAMISVAGAAALLITGPAAISTTGFVHAAAILLALVLLLVTCLTALLIQKERRQVSMISALRNTESLDRFLDALEQNGLTQGYRILRGAELADYDDNILVATLSRPGSMHLADLPAARGEDTLGQSQLRELMARTGTKEAVLVSEAPLAIALGTPPGIATSSGTDLKSAFRLARLIAERDSAQKAGHDPSN